MTNVLAADIERWEAICAAVWRRDKKNKRPHFYWGPNAEYNSGKLFTAVSAHHIYLVEKYADERT